MAERMAKVADEIRFYPSYEDIPEGHAPIDHPGGVVAWVGPPSLQDDGSYHMEAGETCGGLCGHGGTYVLELRDGRWVSSGNAPGTGIVDLPEPRRHHAPRPPQGRGEPVGGAGAAGAGGIATTEDGRKRRSSRTTSIGNRIPNVWTERQRRRSRPSRTGSDWRVPQASYPFASRRRGPEVHASIVIVSTGRRYPGPATRSASPRGSRSRCSRCGG